jgi:cell pole-organizing protein PopZ
MANPSTANEPSMEEILASIRQIISEDGEGSPAARPEGRGKDPAEQDGPPDVDLAAAAPAAAPPRAERAPQQGGPMKPQTSDNAARAQQAVQSSSAPAAPAPAPETRHSAEAPAPVPQPTVAAAKPAPVPAPQRQNGSPEQRPLLSDRSNAAVSGAFGTLTHTILAQHARTLDDLVAEMLRPMLKEWLDDNLPPLVERLVKEEIERVSRGRR